MPLGSQGINLIIYFIRVDLTQVRLSRVNFEMIHIQFINKFLLLGIC